MVDNGIVQKLMDLLDRHVEDGNVTVQHAALSALRNLAIPGKPHFALLITRRWNSVLPLHPPQGMRVGELTDSARGRSDCCFSFRPVNAFMSLAQQLWPAVLKTSQAYWPFFATLIPQYHPPPRKGQFCNRQEAQEASDMISQSFLSKARHFVCLFVSFHISLTAEGPTREQCRLCWNTASYCDFLRL